MNQNPEQLARDKIDAMLIASGWLIQNKNKINLNASLGIAVREYQTDIGPADYVLFVDKKSIGIIEAKRAEEGVQLTMHEDQSDGYATATLKHLNNDPLPFVYESTGEVTRFTDYRDIKPGSRPVFTFHRPETFLEYSKQDKSLRTRLQDIPPLTDSFSSPLGEAGLRDCQIIAINNLEESFNQANQGSDILYKTETKKIIGCAMEVHKRLGNGFQEVIYQRALAIEMSIADLEFSREMEMPIYYRDNEIGARRVDFFVADKIMVEIKAIIKLEDVHLAQAMNYLEAYKMEIGLLINFGARSLEFKRVHNNKILNRD